MTDMPRASQAIRRDAALAHMVAGAEPLPGVDDPAFARMFDRFGDARVVLLGESAPGTSEFYRARAAITRWLIERRGFSTVAFEADAAAARVLDTRIRPARTVGGRRGEATPKPQPLNRDLEGLVGWLADLNRRRPEVDHVEVLGLDRYNLTAATEGVIAGLHKTDPIAAEVARERFGCPAPWVNAPEDRTRQAAIARYARFEGKITSRLVDGLRRQFAERASDADGMTAARAARLLAEAENFYRTMYVSGPEAWNLRSAHLFETLENRLQRRSGARVVVWGHSASVGDARATQMGHVHNAVSLGQICREHLGEAARLIGFAAGGGTVARSAEPAEITTLNPPLTGSLEDLARQVGAPRFLLDLRTGVHSALRRALAEPRLERFIGPTYHPDSERLSHYAECRLPEQFDAWVWLDGVGLTTSDA